MVIGCEIHILLKHRFCWRNHSPLQVASWHSCNGGGSHWNNHHGGDLSLKKTFHKCIHVHVAIEGLMVSFIHNPKLPAHHWVCMAVETVILLFTSVYFPWLLDTEGTCLFLVMLKWSWVRSRMGHSVVSGGLFTQAAFVLILSYITVVHSIDIHTLPSWKQHYIFSVT